MNTQPTRTRQRGLGLVELSTVIAIVGVLAAVATPGLRGVLDARRLDGAATRLAADLQFARSEAVARNQALRFAVQPAAGCWIVHTGSAGDCRCNGDGQSSCSGSASALKTVTLDAADGIRLQTNTASLLFDPVHGTSTPTGSLSVLGRDGRELRHVVNVLGRIRTCTPLGNVPGHVPC